MKKREKREEVLAQVHELVTSGQTVYDACKQVGTNPKGYAIYARKQKRMTTKPKTRKKTLKPVEINIPALPPTTGRLFMLVGGHHDMLEMIRSLR